MPRFLISRLSAIGDVACCLPVASALKVGHEGSHITWIVDRRFAQVVECCTAVDEVIAATPRLSPSSWPTIEGEFDVALDMQGLLKSALPVARSRATQKVGYHWQREGSWLFAQKVLPDPTSIHVTDQYVDVARAVGGVADRAVFNVVPPPEATTKARSLLEEAGIKSPFVVMNPCAAWGLKLWPAEHYASLADLLAKDGVATVLIGGPSASDAALCQSIQDLATAKPASLAGKTSLKEMIALLALADAHVAADTGSIHLSAALDKPSIGLFAVTHPERSCPYGQISNCHYEPAGMDKIAPDAVYRTVKETLA